jgi:hypothetical protein
MKRMSDVFELPVMPPTTKEAIGMTERQVDRMTCAAHAINHADALADALEWMIEIAENSNTGNYEYKEVIAALAVYRGEK